MQLRRSFYSRGGTNPSHPDAPCDGGGSGLLPDGASTGVTTSTSGVEASGHLEAISTPAPVLPAAQPDAPNTNNSNSTVAHAAATGVEAASTSSTGRPRRFRLRVGRPTLKPLRVSRPRIRPLRVSRPRLKPLRVPVRVHTFDSFQYRNYLYLWIATTFSGAGYWLQQIIVGWLTYQVTGSAFWTTVALGLDVLPVLLAGPLGGVITDKFDRPKLLVIIYGYQAVLTAMFATLALAGSLAWWHILVYIVLMGIAMVVTDPARMSLIPNVVPDDHLVNAFALNSMGFSIARLAAPALGGLLIMLAGAGVALAAQAALYVCAMSAAYFLKVPCTKRPALRLREVFSDLGEGVRYVLGDPLLVGLFVVTAIPSTLVMPSIQGLPACVRQLRCSAWTPKAWDC